MNPQGRPNSRPGELLRWCQDVDAEAAPCAWAAEQHRAVGNLVAALAGVAERRKAAAGAGGSRRRGQGPGLASMGLSCHEAPPAAAVSEPSTGVRRRRVWQESRQKWVPPMATTTAGGEGEAAWETTVDEGGALAMVESRAAAAARPFGFARVADALSKDKRVRKA